VLAGELPSTVSWVRLTASLIDAAAAHVLGDKDEAAQGLVRTLVLGAPEELVQPFAETPAYIPGLLELLDAYPHAADHAGAPHYVAILRSRLPALVPPDLRSIIGPTESSNPSRRPGARPDRLRLAGQPERVGPGIESDPARSAAVDTLTARELEVLSMLDSVIPMSAVAQRLYVTVNTLKTHAGAIYRKLGVDNRADAVERAHDLGVLPLD
jgi:DNA-binding CsgD family transcriptional regulator